MTPRLGWLRFHFHFGLGLGPGTSLDGVVKLLVRYAGAVPSSAQRTLLDGPWSSLSAAHKAQLQQHDASNCSTSGPGSHARSLTATLRLYYGVREGSKVPNSALLQLVDTWGGDAGPARGSPEEDGGEEGTLLAVTPPAVGQAGHAGQVPGQVPPPPAPASAAAAASATVTSDQLSDDARLGLRILGAMVIRWAALARCAHLDTSYRTQLEGVLEEGVEGVEPGVPAAPRALRGPCLVPMPKPQGLPVRVCRSDVEGLLRRAGHEPSGMERGDVGLEALLNMTHPAIHAHVARYGGIGSSMVFTGRGLRFVVDKVSVCDVFGDPRDARVFKGGFAALDPARPFERQLYGREEPPPRPPEEIAAKRVAFASGAKGAYLLEHLTPDLVNAHVTRTGAKLCVADPGAGAPMVLDQGTFLSLLAMYSFMSCRYHRAPVPDSVTHAIAGLSGTSPRQFGVVCFSEYLDELGKVCTGDRRLCANVWGGLCANAACVCPARRSG